MFWLAKTKQVYERELLSDNTPTKSGKFKHLEFSENVNFVETNSVDSILEKLYNSILDMCRR